MTKPVDVPMTTPFQRAQFHGAFPQLASAILEEWPQIDAESLASANADLEKVIALVVERTGHTKTLVRKQLEEIFHRQRYYIDPKKSRIQPALPKQII